MHLTAGIWNERSNRLCAMARLSRTRRRCWALQVELLSVHTEPNCSHLKERHPPEGFTVLPGSSEPEVSRETKAADWMSAGSCQKLKAPCSAMQFTPIVATVLSGYCWHRPPPCVRNEILAVNFSIPTLAISETGERPLHSWAFLFQRKNQTTSLDLWSLRCRTFCVSSFNFAPPPLPRHDHLLLSAKKKPQRPAHPDEQPGSLRPAAAQQRSHHREERGVQHGRRRGELRAERQVGQRQVARHVGHELPPGQEGDKRRHPWGGQVGVGGLEAACQVGVRKGHPSGGKLRVVSEVEGDGVLVYAEVTALRLLAFNVTGIHEGGFEEI